jgi:broad specificity phosphatase PhoE
VIRVYLVRHGQTLWNAEGRYQGRIDSALSPLGRSQAVRLARALAAAPFAAVYSSPLVRAWDTALVIAASHRLSVVPVEELREIALGAWEGLTEEEITRRFGDVVARRRRDPERVVPEGGESLAQVQARAMRAMERILARHDDGTIAVVAHGAVNKMILLSALNAPLSSYWRIRQDNAGISIVDVIGAHKAVRVMNETAHLTSVDEEAAAAE